MKTPYDNSLPAKPRGLGRNYALNLFGALVPMLLSLVMVPIYIALIGADRYGIMSLVWILLGYFGFLDLGLSRASANALSRIAHAGPSERVPVLVTAFYLNLGLGVFGGLLVYGVGTWWVSYIAHFSGALNGEIASAIPWTACMLPLSLIAGVGTGAIESRERFLASNILASLGGILGQLLPIGYAIVFGPSLAVIVPAALLARLLWTVAIFVYVIRTEHPVDPRRFDRAQVRALLGYGAWVTITGMLSPILETFDQMLVGSLLGPAAIAHYAVPMAMTSRAQFVALAMAKTLFPRLSQLDGEEAKRLTVRSTVTLGYGFAAICGPAIILAGPFLAFWLGADFAAYSTPVAVILLVGAWTNGIAFIPFTLLQSQGRPDLTAKIHACEVVPFLATVWILTTLFGLSGAAWAWTIRVTIDLVIMAAVGGLLRPELSVAIPAVAITAASWGIATFLRPTGLIAFAVACGVGLAVVGSALLFDSEARTIFANMTRRFMEGLRASRFVA